MELIVTRIACRCRWAAEHDGAPKPEDCQRMCPKCRVVVSAIPVFAHTTRAE